MNKDKVLRIRISDKEKSDLEEVAKQKEVSSSEYARTAIKNRVKKDKKWK